MTGIGAYTFIPEDSEQVARLRAPTCAALARELLPLAQDIASNPEGGKHFRKALQKERPLTVVDVFDLATYTSAPRAFVGKVEDICDQVMPPFQEAARAHVLPVLPHLAPHWPAAQDHVALLLTSNRPMAQCLSTCRPSADFASFLFDQARKEARMKSKKRNISSKPVDEFIDSGWVAAPERDPDEEIVNAGPLVVNLESFVVGRVVGRGKRPYAEAVGVTRLCLDFLQDATLDAGGHVKLPHRAATEIGRAFHLTPAVERGLIAIVLKAVEDWRDGMNSSGQRPDFS